MEKCGSCGATLYGSATYCGQCFTPLVASTPSPFAPRAVGAVAAVAAAPMANSAATTAVLPPVPPWARPAPVEPPFTAPQPPDRKAAKQAEGRIAWPLAFILLLGAVLQGWLVVYATSGVEPVVAARTSTWAVLGFYAVVVAIVVGTTRTVDFRPVWRDGPFSDVVLVWGAVGVFAAAGVMGLVRLAFGTWEADQAIVHSLGDVTPMSIFLTALLLVVAAPVVEELLFRGLVAEAMRHRGHKVALLGSGMLFALWHMRGALVYYTLAGILLGTAYFKRGLVASMSLHAAFNGTLLALALAFVAGTGSVLTGPGIRIDAPGGWKEVEPVNPNQALYAVGPSGSELVVSRELRPVSTRRLEEVAAGINQGEQFLGWLRFEAGSAQIVDYGFGRALRSRGTIDGHAAEHVLVMYGNNLWQVVLATGGSDRAKADFEEMLTTLRLG